MVSFAAGLVVYAPWLMLLLAVALVPSFLGEAHFNALSYALSFVRTPQRRELDYVRQVAASTHTAKEVKIFGLSGFLIERYRTISRDTYEASRKLAIRRAAWGALFTALGTIAYYTPMPTSPGARLPGPSPSATSPFSPPLSCACAGCSKGC